MRLELLKENPHGWRLRSWWSAERIVAWKDAILAALRGDNVIAVPPLFIRRDTTGYHLYYHGFATTATASSRTPLEAYAATATLISVQYGLVQGIVPDIGGVAIGTDPAPTLAPTTSGSVRVLCTTDSNKSISAVSIIFESSESADTATLGYQTIATVAYADDAIVSITKGIAGSLGYNRGCGDTHWWWAV